MKAYMNKKSTLVGYKNSENTEKMDDFRKSNDRKAGECAICHSRPL